MGLKVGVFVLVGLVFLAVFVVLFSQGTAFSGKQMQLSMKSGNVGGIKPGAKIYMAGVPVGRVSGVELGEEGTNVTIFLSVSATRKIYADARFEVEQAGFLGDQYVAIYPVKNQGKLLQNGDVVICRNPFNMQETVAQAAETIMRIGQVTTNVNAAVADVRRYVLTEEKLSRLGAAIDNFGQLVTDAQGAVSNINTLVARNEQPVTAAVSNLSYFSAQLPTLADYVTSLVMSNETEITTAIKNLETASSTMTNLMSDLQHGQGAAGKLLRDEQLAADLSSIARNLSITTSNLNTRGLWGIMWKQKPPPATKESPSISSPKNK